MNFIFIQNAFFSSALKFRPCPDWVDASLIKKLLVIAVGLSSQHHLSENWNDKNVSKLVWYEEQIVFLKTRIIFWFEVKFTLNFQ
jgi:hypothetical protein